MKDGTRRIGYGKWKYTTVIEFIAAWLIIVVAVDVITNVSFFQRLVVNAGFAVAFVVTYLITTNALKK